jgi:WD40 repeat protein
MRLGNTAPRTVAFSPDGTRLAAAVTRPNATSAVEIWDLRTGQVSQTLPGQGQDTVAACDAVAFSPDGMRLATGAQDQAVRVWDSRTGELLFTSRGHAGAVRGLAFSSDGRRLVSTSGQPNGQGPPTDLKLWDAEGKELLALSLPGQGQGVAVSPDGAVVAATFLDNSVRLYEVATGKEVRALRGHTEPPWGVAFSPDGLRIVTGGGADETIKLWDPKTGQEILTVGGHPGLVTSVAFSPDGHKIVSTSLDDVRIWDATPLGK